MAAKRPNERMRIRLDMLNDGAMLEVHAGRLREELDALIVYVDESLEVPFGASQAASQHPCPRVARKPNSWNASLRENGDFVGVVLRGTELCSVTGIDYAPRNI